MVTATLSSDNEDAILWSGEILSKPQLSVYSPLCGRGCDTDNHNSGVGENLLQSFIGFALLQIVSQFLSRKQINENMMLKRLIK